MAKIVAVTKARGDKEPFSVAKLRRSMIDSGAPVKTIDEIVKRIRTLVRPGTSTAEIQRLAFGLLKSTNPTYAVRYNLKKAIMRLGPDGFPFEKYFAALLNNLGYETTTNAILNGRCITHEVDIIAEKNEKNIHAIIESKFHAQPGGKTGAKDALYTYGRFLDIKAAWAAKKKAGAKPQAGELQSWLVTNTEMTSDAINYCNCVGIKVIAWSYPHNEESLQGMIHHRGLYPITALLSLDQNEKRELLRRGIVICIDLLENQKILKRIGLRDQRINQVIKEVNDLRGITQS